MSYDALPRIGWFLTHRELDCSGHTTPAGHSKLITKEKTSGPAQHLPTLSGYVSLIACQRGRLEMATLSHFSTQPTRPNQRRVVLVSVLRL
jgi:predicted PhzF superfamily epimerase YddE/YHI9